MITNLLIFFAIPLAIVVISIALQKLLRNPFLVASIIFSILLIIVLAFFDTVYLIAVVAYTILSFIAALLTCLISRFLRNQICNGFCNNNNDNVNNGTVSTANILNSGIEGTTYTCSSNNQVYNSNNGFSGATGTYARDYRRR